ncbi:MAG: DUF4384 domain-containing protein [Chitinivibrionales bacterium]|nr:DUF4384 domain-containing protein [Chitinivibrionales bacterium]
MNEKHLNTLELTEYVTGDCQDVTAKRIEGQLETDTRARAFVEHLKAQRRQFLAAMPFDAEARPAPQSKLLRFPARTWYAIAASLIIFILAGWRLTVYEHRHDTRIKGDESITIYVQDEDGAVTERTSHVYRPGERIQLTYSCGRFDYFILLGLDESGTVSRYYPPSGASSVQLEKGSDIPLPNSILLDSYLGKELFLGIFSKHPLAVNKIMSTVKQSFEQGASLDEFRLKTGRDVRIRTILITKTAK